MVRAWASQDQHTGPGGSGVGNRGEAKADTRLRTGRESPVSPVC